MIVSASRRTDIPAYYGNWLMKKIKTGFVDVQNPFNANQIKKVSLTPEDVDCFVFWTKNVAPFLEYLNDLKKYHYYFSFTITPYGSDLEKHLPKKEKIVEGFKKLANSIGADRVVWRYDPIIFTDYYNADFHLNAFSNLCHSLAGYTKKCMVSFVTVYKKTERNMAGFKLHIPNKNDKTIFLNELAKISNSFEIKLKTCAMELSSTPSQFSAGACIDANLINSIIETPQPFQKDKSQRNACLCAKSVDIGSYNTCPHGCVYCYANNKPLVSNHM